MTPTNVLAAIVAAWDSSRAEPADVRLDSMFDVIEAARLILSDSAAPTDAVVKITDDMRNVSFIRHTKGRGWACTLGNGTPASMFYAGIESNSETVTKIALERAKTAADVLRIVKNAVRSSRYNVELV